MSDQETIAELRRVLNLAVAMRKLQRQYFAHRRPEDMNAAKSAEIEFDREARSLAARLKGETLFP